MPAAPSRVRKLRRCLLWILAGIALSQLVLGTAVERCLPGVRDPEFQAKLERLRARRREAPDRPLVLVIGSSRSLHGLDAGSLGKDRPAVVFNFGIGGSGPAQNLLTLCRLLDAGIRPDLVYLELLPALLADSKVLLEEKLLDGARLRLGEVRRLRRYYRSPQRLLNGWWLGRLLPCYRHQAELRDVLIAATPSNGIRELDGHGWARRPGPISAQFRRDLTGLAHDQYRAACAAQTLAAGPVRAVEDTLDLCRRRGIPVRLLLMPEGKGFRALYSPASQQALAGLLNRLTVPVVDARDWVEETGFWDTHHLLAEGARCFTDRFGREALAPALDELGRQRRAMPTELPLPTPVSRR